MADHPATDANGVWTATVSSTAPGDARIVAELLAFDGPRALGAAKTVHFAPATLGRKVALVLSKATVTSTSSLAVAPTLLVANGVDGATVRVVARDAANRPWATSTAMIWTTSSKEQPETCCLA